MKLQRKIGLDMEVLYTVLNEEVEVCFTYSAFLYDMFRATLGPGQHLTRSIAQQAHDVRWVVGGGESISGARRVQDLKPHKRGVVLSGACLPGLISHLLVPGQSPGVLTNQPFCSCILSRTAAGVTQQAKSSADGRDGLNWLGTASQTSPNIS